jgi:hypothetical protein
MAVIAVERPVEFRTPSSVVRALPEVLAGTPHAGYGNVRENPDGSVDFFYGRFYCASSRWDVFKISDPPPGP